MEDEESVEVPELAICGYEPVRDKCVKCEFLFSCKAGSTLIGRKIDVHRHPDRLTIEFLFSRGEWDAVETKYTKQEIKLYSSKYREHIEGERKKLGLSH